MTPLRSHTEPTHGRFSQAHRLLRLTVAAALLSTTTIGNAVAAAPPTDKERMDGLVNYAETILKHGRDVYGEKETPLIPNYLEVDTLRAPEQEYITRVGGPGPRQRVSYQPAIASNLAYQGNLQRFLVGISNLTGDPKYKEFYKEGLRYHFAHYAQPNGLLSMGHHRWINLVMDDYDGDGWPRGGSGHEVKGDHPYYPLFWEADPNATRRMLSAHWSSHIQDWGFMNFTRHGSYVKELNEAVLWDRPRTEPVVGIVSGNLTFFDSGGDIIWAGAQLGILNKDDRPLYWAQRLFARYSDSAPAQSGLPPWHHTMLREFGSQEEPVPEYALLTRGSLGVVGVGGGALLRIAEALGEEKGKFYRERMLKHLKSHARLAYDPEKNLMKNVLFDGTDLAERDRKNDEKAGKPNTPVWIPWNPDPHSLHNYALCYKLTRDGEIWDTLRAMVRGNDLGDIGPAGGKEPTLNLATAQSEPLLIFPLVEIFRATDNKAYLDVARSIANNAFSQHFRADQGLFTQSELHRTANLCSAEPLALLTLEAALRGKPDQVPSYANSNQEGGAAGLLRPLKSRPYKPAVSHEFFPDPKESMCDDMLPKSSNDTTVPVMSWDRARKPTDEAIVTFPDIFTGPVSITAIADLPESRNSVSGMIVESPHSITFTGALEGTGDLSFTASHGEHLWAEGSTWTTTAWSPDETYDFVMNISKGAKLTFSGLVQEQQGMAKWSSHRGAGIIKNGDGTVVLTADHAPLYNAKLNDNRAYRAPTVVNAGLLLVNNTAGSGISPRSTVEVNHGATLGGSGTIGIGGTSAPVVVYPGGKIAPGDGLGILTLKDGLELHNGARLEIECGDKVHDVLKITGGTFRGAGEGGIVITIKDIGGMKPGMQYEILDWTGATYVDVDVSDFRLDRSQHFQGDFAIEGTKLRFGVFAPRIPPESPPAMPPAVKIEKPRPKPFVTGAPPPPKTHFTWSNPKGGEWSASANWKDGKIPNAKETEWAQYQFEKPRRVSGVQVYWFDNATDRKVPKSWRMLYKQNGEWKPVEAQGDYAVKLDTFNEVKFKPVETDSLRLEVHLQDGVAAGIHEWQVMP
ncbi:MAG: discoidin domain-containing protein [Verrucomicrobiales bacterium]